MNFFRKQPKWLKRLLLLLLALFIAYCLGRLWYKATGGFTEGNINYNLTYDPQWDVRALDPKSEEELAYALSQPYYYLGKGCQSYVFSSLDGKFVVKFFKYQRFKPQWWLNYLTFVPLLDTYNQEKTAKKKIKLDNAFSSWKLAYEDLKKETGVLYVHLNKGVHLKKDLTVFDKLGLQHTLCLDNLEFMVQKKAEMLCPVLLKMKQKNEFVEAQKLMDRLLSMLINEYQRGVADNDHALMQNTGVFEGFPIHIDVGQFVKNTDVMKSKIYHQELFNKTWKFRLWLEKHYPELAAYLKAKLEEEIGDAFSTMQPMLSKGDVGRIPHLF